MSPPISLWLDPLDMQVVYACSGTLKPYIVLPSSYIPDQSLYYKSFVGKWNRLVISLITSYLSLPTWMAPVIRIYELWLIPCQKALARTECPEHRERWEKPIVSCVVLYGNPTWRFNGKVNDTRERHEWIFILPSLWSMCLFLHVFKFS